MDSVTRIGLCVAFVSGLCLPLGQIRAEDAKEEFQTRLFIANVDGSNMKPLTNLNEYQAQGSPSWSRDGKLIAFDGWKPQMGESFSNSKVIVVNADGTNPRIFEDSAMPSFSPGGHRMVVSRPKAGGVWVTNVDGTSEDDFVTLDDRGWGADWSPDGKIVYAKGTKAGGNMTVVELVEGRVTPVFGEDQTPYVQICWNMGWSPDGKRIAYKALDRDQKIVIGIVDARGEKFGHVIRDRGQVLESVAWTPDSSQILYVKMCPERGQYQIYSASPDTMDEPKLLGGLEADRGYRDMAFSPDGKQLIISCAKKGPAVKPAADK